jgi:uncharacterized phage protein gp47/JayE
MPTPIAPYIDSTGVHVPAYSDILAYFQGGYRTIFGADVYIEPDSQDGQLIGITSLAINDAMASVAAAYNAFSPATAQGTGLSSVVKINGLQRAIPTFSTVDLTLVGVAGTVISSGQVQDQAGFKWALPATVTIPNAGVIVQTATCQTAGAINAAAGAVTQIITPTRGWQTVTNPAAAVPGSPVEVDATLRQRQGIASGLPAISDLGSIKAALGQITGVTEVAIHENYTDTTDAAGTPPHSIACVVTGGDVNTIAQTIALKKTPGGNTFGTTSVLTTDTNGLPITINFSRATTVPVNVAVTLTAQAGYSSDVTAAIKTSVAAFLTALNDGQTMEYTQLFPPALLFGQPGYGTYNLTAMTANGGTVDIPVAYNQTIIAGTVLVNGA